MGVEIRGLDELRNDIAKIANEAPDEASKILRKVGNIAKKETIVKTRQRTITNPKDKYTLVKNYGLTQIEGYGLSQEISLFTKSPHFSLVENGHEMVTPKTRKGKPLKNGGKHVGKVDGKHMLEDTLNELEPQIPELYSKMIDKIFKKYGM